MALDVKLGAKLDQELGGEHAAACAPDRVENEEAVILVEQEGRLLGIEAPAQATGVALAAALARKAEMPPAR